MLGVNTTRPYRHTDGEVSMRQIRRVAARLKAADEAQLRVVLTHQPVAVTRAQDEKNLLRGRERAVQRWACAGANLILGGRALAYFVARVVYVPLYAAGVPFLRSLVWLASVVGIVQMLVPII